jgi:hypothetical protein
MATQEKVFKNVTLKYLQNLRVAEEFRGKENYKCSFINFDKDKWKASGVQTRPREDSDGDMVYTLKRPPSKVMKGKEVVFGPPKIMMPDGSLLPEDKYIGNGSTADLEFITYDTSMGTGHRLNVVKLIDFKEYVMADPEEEEESIDVLDATDEEVPFD